MNVIFTDEEVVILQNLYDHSYLKPDVYWPLFINRATALLRDKGVIKDD